MFMTTELVMIEYKYESDSMHSKLELNWVEILGFHVCKKDNFYFYNKINQFSEIPKNHLFPIILFTYLFMILQFFF